MIEGAPTAIGWYIARYCAARCQKKSAYTNIKIAFVSTAADARVYLGRLFRIQVYRRKYRHKTFEQLFRRSVETILKCLIILTLAAIPAAFVIVFWYYGLHTRGIFFEKQVREVLISGWIQSMGILYALIAGVALNWVAQEYKEIRLAVKRGDLDTFLLLRDEDLSPMMHAMIAVIALAVLVGFMGLEYQSAATGIIMVGGSTYIFALLCLVVYELDDPCGGIWYIKAIPEEWLVIDPKKWREENIIKKKKETLKPKQ